MFNNMVSRSGNDPKELLLKAIALYMLALDAEANGNHLAIVTADGEIDQDITGL